jgi:hypothetical protein
MKQHMMGSLLLELQLQSCEKENAPTPRFQPMPNMRAFEDRCFEWSQLAFVGRG